MKLLEDVAVIMEPKSDQIAVAKVDINLGTILKYYENSIEIKSSVRQGQRFALVDLKDGEFIKQYGYPFAQSKGLVQGEQISPHNTRNILPEVDETGYQEPKRTVLLDTYVARTFNGFKRRDGKVGTRNYYLIIPTSMCASETALQVALSLDNNDKLINQYPNLDGIVAVPHSEGCGCDSGLQIDRLLSVLKGYVSHPNVGGCLIMDLGCEQTNYDKVHKYLKNVVAEAQKPIDWLTIQESGGTRPSVEKAKKIINLQLPKVNLIRRKPAPIAELIIGTECGASDSFSGITANPIIGNAVDKVIFGGGSAILSEVTEMVGTYGMLLHRFRNLETANKFKGALEWYERMAKKLDLTLEPNLVPKNIEGGLINNFIKSLGAVMKGGRTTIEDVVDYAYPLKRKGLSIMQGPGNDPESVTGLVASGATIICFSTGKGTTTGEAICPVIKIASNKETFEKLGEDMDFDGSRLLREKKHIDEYGEELLEMIIAVASGEKTWSEKWKQRQFQIWTAGKLSL